MRVLMMTEMSWQVNEEVSRDMTGEADGKNLEVDYRDGVMHIWMSDLWFWQSYHKNNKGAAFAPPPLQK